MITFLRSITLFEVAVVTVLFCLVWAVVHRFNAEQLAVIGGTVGGALWGRIKGQV